MKELIIIVSIVGMLSMVGCSNTEKTVEKMYIESAQLTEEEEKIAALLGLNTQQQIYDFVLDETVQSIQVNTYRLIDGEWKLETGGGGQAFSDTTGRIALSFDRLDEEIKAVTVELYPPDTKAELDEEEIEDLVEILHQVVIYKKDDTYNEYCGQAVNYKITKHDGATIEVQAYNPFLIIDGIGYTTKYEPCQQLNSLGNKINDRNH